MHRLAVTSQIGGRFFGSPQIIAARSFNTSLPSAGLFHEFDKKSGYKDKTKQRPTELIREGLKELKNEIRLWTSEVQDKLKCDPIIGVPLPGEVDVQWKFSKDMDMAQWIVTSDSDHNEGYSSASLSLSPTGKGLFSGNLSTQTVRDGQVKRSGYCNFRSIQPTRSFQRETFHDWSLYTHLVLRVRGDGRSYMLNIGSAGYFDMTWNDMFNFILYTRGGPHWQISKIPFSRFFLASKGRVQDKQEPIPLQRVTNFGISAADKNNGPFRLEIDYIGLEYDPSHTETTAYEMYRTPKFFAGY